MKLNLVTLTGMTHFFLSGFCGLFKSVSYLFWAIDIYAARYRSSEEGLAQKNGMLACQVCIYMYSVISSANAERKTVIVETVESCNLL